MSFIGIVSNSKNFELLKSRILNSIDNMSDLSIININKESIDNVKNIKFETLVICNDISIWGDKRESLKSIGLNSKYVVVNTDCNDDFNNAGENIITYGLNRNADITTSSVKEDKVLVAIQKEIKDVNGKTIDVGESKIYKKEKINLQNMLALYVIYTIYGEKKPKNKENFTFFE
jgi:hypothetical protein